MNFFRQVGALPSGQTFASTRDNDNQDVFKHIPVGSMGSQHGLLDALKHPISSFYMDRLQSGLNLYNDHFHGSPPISDVLHHDKLELIDRLVQVAVDESAM